MNPLFAKEFAQEWIAAWNAADLERIFLHYADDFELSSPYIAERGFSQSGTLKGKEAVRPYWSGGLAATPPLHFDILHVFAGSDCISIHYRSRGRRVACETFIFDQNRRVIRSMATHAVDLGE
jgi:hypothetical protein